MAEHLNTVLEGFFWAIGFWPVYTLLDYANDRFKQYKNG